MQMRNNQLISTHFKWIYFIVFLIHFRFFPFILYPLVKDFNLNYSKRKIILSLFFWYCLDDFSSKVCIFNVNNILKNTRVRIYACFRAYEGFQRFRQKHKIDFRAFAQQIYYPFLMCFIITNFILIYIDVVLYIMYETSILNTNNTTRLNNLFHFT